MGIHMEGFFDGANVVFGTPASTAPTAAQGVPVEALIPSTGSVPISEGTHTKRVSEATPILAETLTPQEGVIPLGSTQTEVASPTIPLVISTSDPFAALSQNVKDGSSLVVTPSSIPSSATREPNADLSSERSEEVLEDPDNEPTKKETISDSNEEESVDSKTEFMGMPLSLSLFFLLSLFLPFLLSSLYISVCVIPLLRSPFISYAHFPWLQRLRESQELQ